MTFTPPKNGAVATTTSRSRAEAAYLDYRNKGEPPREAIRLAAHATSEPAETITSWAADGRWEDAQERTATARELAKPPFSASSRLGIIAISYETAQRTLARAEQRLEVAEKKDDDPKEYTAALGGWDRALSRFIAIQKAAAEAEVVARRRHLESPVSQDLAEYEESVYQELMTQYGDYGPQYAVLSAEVASLRRRQKQLAGTGRDVPTGEVLALDAEIRANVAQMQRYTESTKQETLTAKFDEGVSRALKVMVDMLESREPKLAKELIARVKAEATEEE